MRLEIELFAKEKKKINLNYNYYIISAIYHLLSEHNRDFSEMLHDQGYEIGGKKFKLFVFSKLMPEKYTIEGNSMIIKSGITRLYVNSPVKEFINCIGNSLMKIGNLKIGKEEFVVSNVYLRNQVDFEYETEFVTLSPIIVTTGEMQNGQFKSRTVHISEEKYIENIKNNLIRKYFLIHGKLPQNMSIDIQFDEKYTKNNRGKLIDFKGITVKGYIAPFKMKCSEDIKRVALDCGIGENNSIGMGYIMEKKLFVDLW
jgi:CRISPR-associated endoribonuclease Cas6